MQRLDFQWYKQNLPELYEKYGDCYLSIKDKMVLGTYSSFPDAVNETAKVHPLGSFIVQKCGKDESAYTNYIASMNFM